jgi:alanyl-tRNA synthetase
VTKSKDVLVGYGIDAVTQEQRPVIAGEHVFKLMDSHGLPFDLIQELLEENKLAYDVPGFIAAAHKSKNYSKERLTNLLIPPDNKMSDQHKRLTQYCIDKAYNDS